MTVRDTNAKPDIRFIVETTKDSDYLKFIARAVYMVEPEPSSWIPNDAGVRNPSDSDINPHIAPLADFAITAQASGDMSVVAFHSWYGHRACYQNVYNIELRRAERMARLLRKLDRHLTKLDQTFGYTDDLAAFCGRVAIGVGVTTKTSTFGFYSKAVTMNGTNYRWTNVDGLRSHLNDFLQENR